MNGVSVVKVVAMELAVETEHAYHLNMAVMTAVEMIQKLKCVTLTLVQVRALTTNIIPNYKLLFFLVDGYWTEWSDWNDCSKSCGNGLHTRTRQCIPPKYGGADCTGSATETAQCNTHPCPSKLQ